MKHEIKTYIRPDGSKIKAIFYNANVQWHVEGKSNSQTLDTMDRFYKKMERNQWREVKQVQNEVGL